MKQMMGLAFALLCGIGGCQEQEAPQPLKEKEGDGKIAALYQIEQGVHASTSSYQPLENINTIQFRAKFDSTAIYQTKDPENQADLNKLWGFADCSSHHHANSARFGWRWYQNQLQIWAYWYRQGERNRAFMGVVQLGKYHHYSIRLEPGFYVFALDGNELKLARGCSGPAEGYTLYPYFGGDEAAPHTITLWVDAE